MQRLSGNDFVIRKLTLERASEMGLIQVTETEDFYDMKVVRQWNQWEPQEKIRKRRSQVLHGGWAILTPEDNLFFFLKNERNGMNRYYLTMAVESSLWKESSQIRLILYHHDFPLELEEQDTDQGINFQLVKEQTEKNLIHFEKVM